MTRHKVFSKDFPCVQTYMHFVVYSFSEKKNLCWLIALGLPLTDRLWATLAGVAWHVGTIELRGTMGDELTQKCHKGLPVVPQAQNVSARNSH